MAGDSEAIENWIITYYLKDGTTIHDYEEGSGGELRDRIVNEVLVQRFVWMPEFGSSSCRIVVFASDQVTKVEIEPGI